MALPRLILLASSSKTGELSLVYIMLALCDTNDVDMIVGLISLAED